MQAIAVAWQIYGLTHRPLDLGLVGLAQFAPAVLLFLVAGHTADRVPRKRIIATCYAGFSLCSMLLLGTIVQRAIVGVADLCRITWQRDRAGFQRSSEFGISTAPGGREGFSQRGDVGLLDLPDCKRSRTCCRRLDLWNCGDPDPGVLRGRGRFRGRVVSGVEDSAGSAGQRQCSRRR